jgi:hypothetical protein
MSKELGEPLVQKLAGTRRWWRITRLLAGTGWAACAVIALALLCYHLDRALALSSAARVFWRAAIALAGLGVFGVGLLYAFLRRLPDSSLAAVVERRYPVLRERLLTTIDLMPALSPAGGPSSGFSPAMTRALVEETGKVSEPLDFRRAINTRPVRVATYCALAGALFMGLDYALAPNAFANWLDRMANPNADIAPWAETRVNLTPGATVLPRGESLTVTIRTSGVIANQAILKYRQDGETDWRAVTLTRYTAQPPVSDTKTASDRTAKPNEGARYFTYRLPALAQSVSLMATANDGRSNERRVLVEDRPTLVRFRMKLTFPSYMRRADQTLPESTGSIAAPVGTEVTVEATANKPLKSADMVQDGKERGPWQVDETKVKGRLAVWKNGKYGINLIDHRGFDNPTAPTYEIRALEDQTPNVQITRPTSDMDLVPEGSLPLVARATDDYGVVKMALNYDNFRTESGRLLRQNRGSLPLPGPTGAPSANVSVRWNIGSIRPQPGDLIQCEVTATDNDTLRGPHVGRSSLYRIRVVSLLEMQRRLKDQLNEEARMLAALRQKQIEAQRQLHDTRLKQPNDNAALQRAQEAQRSVAQETRSLTQRMEDLSAQLENNNLATKSELQRREQAEQTLQNLAQQKMPATAESIQQAQNQKANSAIRRENLNQADRQQTDNRQDIEKAQQLLSRTPTPERMAEEAARLAQEQQRLTDSSRFLEQERQEQRRATGSNAMTPEQKAGMEMERRQQAEITRDTQKLQAQLQQAARSAEERGQKQAADALRKAAQALQKGNAAGNQQEAQRQLNQNNPGQAAPSQQKAANALQNAAEAAKEASNSQDADSPQAAAERLEKAAEQLRQMAQKQREVANQIGQNPNAQQSRQLGAQEQNLQNQAGQMQAQLQGSRSAQQSLRNARQNLNQSGQQLNQNSPQSAQQPANRAAQQLEQAARQAERSAQQMRQQQMAAEMAEKVERLAQDQRALQSATRRLNQTEQGRKLNSTELRELGQVAARQQTTEQKARDIASQMASPVFKQAMEMAARQMTPARRNLYQDQPNTGQDTQESQNRAAQTLEAVAQALKQQGQNSSSQNAQNGQNNNNNGGMSAQQAQQQAALGELMLAQMLQKQLRQETGQLDQQRARNPEQSLTPRQQQQAGQLTETQQETREITQGAGEQLADVPGLPEAIQQATQEMNQAAQRLSQKQTGRQTQTNQENAMRNLDRAIQQAQQQQQQQQQQQMAQQQGQQGAPQPVQQPGNTPKRNPFTRLEDPNRGRTSAPGGPNGVFSALSPRSQRVLREGQQERAPAEFQDIVNRYYKSLAEKKR